VLIMKEAIKEARAAGVPLAHLGLAVHPYHYSTDDRSRTGPYWRNFYQMYPYIAPDGTPYTNRYAGPCYDLAAMIATWHARNFAGLNLLLVFTKDNWSDHPEVTPSRPQPNGTHKLDGTQACSNVDGCEGTYLVDLFTWLYDHRQLYHTDGDAAYSPLRVAWYHGADKAEPAVFAQIGQGGLGLYKVEGAQKQFHITFCANRYNPNLGQKPAGVVSTQFQQRQRVPCY